MKYSSFTWLFVLLFVFSYSAHAQYCVTAPTTTAEGEITNVVLNGATYNISNFTTCPTTAALEDYTSTDSTDLVEGSSYTATITISPCGGFALDPGACEGWIDWNQNNTFDASESIGTWTGNIWSSNKTATFNFTVPAGATPGATRMRLLLRQGFGSANTPPLNPCGSGFTYGSVEDYTIRVTPLPSLCPNPISPSVANTTDSSATLYWGSTDTSFHYEYGLQGFTQGAGILDSVNNDTLILAGLAVQTSYDYYVRANCNASGNGTSTWIGPIPFSTKCSSKSLPYLDDFNSWPVTCFDSTGGDFTFSSDTGSSSVVATMNGRSPGEQAILTSPSILITTDAQVSLKWSHFKVSWANDKLFIYVREVGTVLWEQVWSISGNAFQSASSGPAFPGTFVTETLNLKSSYVGKNVELKVVAEAGGYGGNIYVDDFEVSAQPPCAQITGVGFSNILATTADVNFAAAGNKFPIEWGIHGFQQGTGIFDTAVSNTFTLHSLSVNESYDVYLRRDCSAQGGSLTPWIGPFFVTTNCGDFPNTYTTNFDSDSVGVTATCWSVLSGSPSQAVVYQPSPTQSIQPYSVPNYFQSSTQGILLSPEFSTIDQDQKQIEFWGRRTFGSIGGATVIVGTISDPTIPSTFNAVDTIFLPASWTFVTVVLDSVPTGHNYVGFKLAPNTSNSTFGIDDFSLVDQPPCLPAAGFKARNLTESSALISWLAKDANSWSIEYGISGFTPGNGTTVSGLTTNSYALSGLLANTCYDVYINSACSNGTNSAGPFTFCTLCGPVLIPYTQDFTTWPLACWTNSAGIRDWDNYATALYDMARANMTSWSPGQEAILKTQPFNLNQVARVRFKWSHVSLKDELYFTVRIQPSDYWDTLGIWTGAAFESPNGPNTNKYVPNMMVDEIFYLDSATYYNKVVEFKFEAVAGNSGAPLFVDDFAVEPIPLCPEPVNFYVDSITGYTGIAHWQGSGAKYKIEYGPDGFGQGTGISFFDSTYTNSYQFNGLNPTTCYDYYVRNECGTNGNSNWMGPYSFCTGVSCPQPKNVKLHSTTTTSAWVGWETGGAASWNIALGSTPLISSATITMGITSDSIQLTSLQPSSIYYFWVRDSCGPGDVSKWEGPMVFSTGCSNFGLNYEEGFNKWFINVPLTCWSVNGGDKPWESYSFGSGNLASFKASLYNSGEVGQLQTPRIYISDTAVLRFKWSHTIDINNPNDSLLILSRIAGASAWDTLKIFTQSNFILANATAITPAPNLAVDSLELPGNYVGSFVEVNFFALSDNGSDIFVDDVIVEVVSSKVSCAPPANIMASSLTTSSASIDWSSNGSSWQLSYGIGLIDGNQGTQVSTTVKPYVLSGLSAGAHYNVFIREICSSSDTSAWSLAYSFNTRCSLKSMPFVEDFAAWTTPSNLPCWSLDGGTKSFGPFSVFNQTQIAARADYYYSWNAGDNAMMTTPEIDLKYPAILTMKWTKEYRFNRDDSLFVLARVAGTINWDTLAVKGGPSFDCNCSLSSPNMPSGYVLDTFNIPLSFVGQNVECAFFAVGEKGYNLFIHEVTVEQDPVLSCIGADGLVVDSVSCDGGVVSWNSTNSTLLSNLVYGLKGFDPTTAGTSVSNVVSPYSLSGLLPGVDYDIYVQDSCAVGLSPFVKGEFKTLNSPLPVIIASHVVNTPSATNTTVMFDASSSIDANSYLWQFGDGDSSNLGTVNHDYTSNGTYTVTLFVSNGCGTVDTTFSVNIQGIDIKEAKLLESIRIFPNPTQGKFAIDFGAFEGQEIEISVSSMQGQMLVRKIITANGTPAELDLSAFQNGTYMVLVKLENAQSVNKVILQR